MNSPGIPSAAFAAVLLGAVSLPGARFATAHSAQRVPVEAADLAGTPDLARRDPGTLHIVASGDYNGDLVEDRARIVKDRRSSEYAVTACLSRPLGPCRESMVASGPLAHLATLGIATIRADDLRDAFVRTPEGRALRARMSRAGASDFLEVFAFEASSTVYIWTGSAFEAVPVAD